MRATWTSVAESLLLVLTLAAFVDKRIGQRSLQGLGTWSQVDAALDH